MVWLNSFASMTKHNERVILICSFKKLFSHVCDLELLYYPSNAKVRSAKADGSQGGPPSVQKMLRFFKQMQNVQNVQTVVDSD